MLNVLTMRWAPEHSPRPVDHKMRYCKLLSLVKREKKWKTQAERQRADHHWDNEKQCRKLASAWCMHVSSSRIRDLSDAPSKSTTMACISLRHDLLLSLLLSPSPLSPPGLAVSYAGHLPDLPCYPLLCNLQHKCDDELHVYQAIKLKELNTHTFVSPEGWDHLQGQVIFSSFLFLAKPVLV